MNIKLTSSMLICVKAALACAVCLAAAGCGGAPPVDPALVARATGPHGGPEVALPENQGFAEVVVETASGSTKANRRVVLAVYFLGPDCKAPLAAPPTTVSASVITPESPEPKPVTLLPDPAATKRDGSARFASLPGDYEYDELRGELTISLNGQNVVRPFTRL